MKIRCVVNSVCAMAMMALLAATISGCATTPTSEGTGEYFDSATITTKVKSAYASDPVVSALRVHVTTYKGVVQLSGFVSSAVEKQKAETIARSVAGVKDVKNGIVVK